MYNKQIAVW